MIPLATRIFNLLSADAAVSALVADRIYPTLGKQGGVTPYIVWQEIVSVGQTTHDGDDDTDGGLDQTDIQFGCYSNTASEAYAVRAAVRAALMKKGALAGTKVNSPVQRTFHEEEVEKHNAQLDLTFWHNPTQ